MARVPLGQGAFNRTFGRYAEVVLKNRFFEVNPTNQTDGVALLSRPGSTFENNFGVGPIRKQFNKPGLHEGDNFIVSNDAFYRYDVDGNSQLVSGSVGTNGTPSMAGVKGAGYQRVFIADGQSLQYYGGQAYDAILSVAAGTIANDIVVVDGIYYQFSAGSVDTGAPAGTVGNPWKVNAGASNAAALTNLRNAINADGVNGTPGTDFSTATVANARVVSNANTATTVTVRGRVAGPLTPTALVSVTIVTTDDTLSWNHSPLAANAHVLYGVETPDDIGIISVAELGSFILCVQANSQRVYFIRPGETTIDPLDFFEAESDTDDLIEVVKVGDQVWLVGSKSIEAWYLNGSTDPDANPFSRVQGRPFSIGAIEGTIVVLANSVFLVGDDHIAYRIQGGPTPISNPAISERIRKALKAEKENA